MDAWDIKVAESREENRAVGRKLADKNLQYSDGCYCVCFNDDAPSNFLARWVFKSWELPYLDSDWENNVIQRNQPEWCLC